MKCPLCKAPTEIKDTRLTSKGYVRSRKCFNDHVFKTVETPLTEPKKKRSKHDRD